MPCRIIHSNTDWLCYATPRSYAVCCVPRRCDCCCYCCCGGCYRRCNIAGAYFVENVSRVDTVPISTLRNASTGLAVMQLEESDFGQLLGAGFKFPEPYTAKADDGVTDIYGVMCALTWAHYLTHSLITHLCSSSVSD